jgi:hypothetical protein
MPPQLYENGQFVQHPLEQLFNASAWDILSAIERGFRAQVDVKGKLAEWFLYKHLTELQRLGVVQRVEWRDQDGVPDFLLEVGGRSLQMECKNIRSGRVSRSGWRVEIQKTRNQIGGGPARGYKADEFDILAACLFNQSGQWSFLFAAAANLERRLLHQDYLVIMQKVPMTGQGYWHEQLQSALTEVLGPSL